MPKKHNEDPPPILFSEIFEVDPHLIEKHGAFNISLIADLPLFIDPFLLFNSKKKEYQDLHEQIIDYLRFLKGKSAGNAVTPGLLSAWYRFKEVKQTWLGFTAVGNSGNGLGKDFADALNENFSTIFVDYGEEDVTKSPHLEKLCLVKEGVGKDHISDFTTNLIKGYLLRYTEEFAKKYINPKFCDTFSVVKAEFSYKTETWITGKFYLPRLEDDYVLLTPKDLLTKDDTWINKVDLIEDFHRIPSAISNIELRDQVNNYFREVLPRKPRRKDEREAARKTIMKFPVLVDYYIKLKEQEGDLAQSISEEKVSYSENLFIHQFANLIKPLTKAGFYQLPGDSYSEALQRAQYLKHVIENNDGYRSLYDKQGRPIQKEENLKILYRLTWFASNYDFNTEVNNGRGPADGKVSLGSRDSTVVEFKLASNSQLERNLKNQVQIYEQANSTKKSVKVILYFTAGELAKVRRILKKLGLEGKENIILIDARKDNKPSASKA